MVNKGAVRYNLECKKAEAKSSVTGVNRTINATLGEIKWDPIASTYISEKPTGIVCGVHYQFCLTTL